MVKYEGTNFLDSNIEELFQLSVFALKMSFYFCSSEHAFLIVLDQKKSI